MYFALPNFYYKICNLQGLYTKTSMHSICLFTCQIVLRLCELEVMLFQIIPKLRFRLPILENLWKTMNEETKIVPKLRYDGRIKKRKWQERRTDKGEGLGIIAPKQVKQDTEVTSELIEKIKRRKFTLLLGYSGTGYFGMQRNPNTVTIEEELFKALLNLNYITDENFAQVQTSQFQRAARTDKGVSAVRQVCSMKLPENVEIAKINEHLPETIRVFGMKRVTKGFNSKSQCDSRTYIYMIPTVAFVAHDVMMNQIGFRSKQETLDRLNKLLTSFLGTKNYHNFTSKKKATDPSAKRFMKSFVCEPPFVRDDIEFVLLKVQGQSFMMHQIRKMIGLTIAIIKGYTGEETLEAAFSLDKINIPRAPGLGLVLDYVHYDRYNYRYGEDGVHEKLTWEELDEEINAFRDKYIFSTIVETELKDEAMVNWIVTKLSGHKFDSPDDDDDEEDDKSDDEKKSSATINT